MLKVYATLKNKDKAEIEVSRLELPLDTSEQAAFLKMQTKLEKRYACELSPLALEGGDCVISGGSLRVYTAHRKEPDYFGHTNSKAIPYAPIIGVFTIIVKTED